MTDHVPSPEELNRLLGDDPTIREDEHETTELVRFDLGSTTVRLTWMSVAGFGEPRWMQAYTDTPEVEEPISMQTVTQRVGDSERVEVVAHHTAALSRLCDQATRLATALKTHDFSQEQGVIDGKLTSEQYRTLTSVFVRRALQIVLLLAAELHEWRRVTGTSSEKQAEHVERLLERCTQVSLLCTLALPPIALPDIGNAS